MFLVAFCLLATACEDYTLTGDCRGTHYLPDENPLPMDTAGYNSVAVILSNFRFKDTSAYPVKVEAYIMHHNPDDVGGVYLVDDLNYQLGDGNEYLYAKGVPPSVDRDSKIRLTGKVYSDIFVCSYLPIFTVTDEESIN